MSMKPESLTWQEAARKLRLNERQKIPHCGPDATAYISNNAKGVSLHCFRCMSPGTSDFEAHGRMSAADYLEMRRADEEAKEVSYPDVQGLSEAPTHARLWLLRAGIMPERAERIYGFGWYRKANRVVLPILHDGEPTGQWLGRATDGRRPKYLIPKGSAGGVWYDTRGSKVVVVCEDVLSAIRISEASYGAMSVLGTNVSAAQASLLQGKTVVGWFDGDAAGEKAWVRLRKICGVFGLEPVRINTPKDPKLHSKREIKEKIEWVLT